MSLFPVAVFDRIGLDEANAALVQWEHRMGPLARGVQGDRAYGLYHDGQLVGVATDSSLIRETVAGAPGLNRANARELSRLCAARSGLCRVVLRLWRELAFPAYGIPWAVSYQDADLHTGNTYRFDGWTRVAYSHSGTDTRSGRKGRNKWVWIFRNLAAGQAGKG